ncbi:MAG: flavin reductase family protein [Bacteriovoracaceae bacterium]|nr:flavin reductase family protein [Bacteriovoracaceae bacterium]
MRKVDKVIPVGHIPSGLFVVCAKNTKSGSIDGYLASWLQQISFKPLLIAVAIKPSRSGYQDIISGETFSVNIVGENESDFLQHFVRGYSEDDNPFIKLNHKVSDDGGIILENVKSVLDCKYVSKTIPGDHEIIIAEVIASYIVNDDTRPRVHVRETGDDY